MNVVRHKQELLESVSRGDVPRVARLLREGGGLNAIYPNGKTLLITAVQAGRRSLVEYLIAMGANLNQRDFADRTPLMYAADRANIETTQRLLEAGAEVNARNRQGRSALMYAAYQDAVDVVAALLHAGASVNLPDRKDRTALQYTSSRRARNAQQLLREHGGSSSGGDFRDTSEIIQDIFHNISAMDEFTELKRSPAWGWKLLLASYALVCLILIVQPVLGPIFPLLLLPAGLVLFFVFPSMSKLVPSWREIRRHRSAGSSPSPNPGTARKHDPKESDVQFVSQLTDLGARELSSIHSLHAESRSLPVLTSLFKSRRRSAVLALSIFLPILILLLPGALGIRAGSEFYSSTGVGILYLAMSAALPVWVLLAFRLERRLRLERVRLVQQERDRMAAQVATMLSADASPEQELPTEFGLYLRAFMTTDKLHLKGFDLETMLAYSIAPTLPLVALGKPGEHLGAGRIQTTDEYWQDEILRLMQTARLILIIPSHRAGTLWEIATLRDGGFLEKTIFIMPPELNFHGGKFSMDWQKTVQAASEVGVEFPNHIAEGALFRLSPDGEFTDYAPFVPDEFLMEYDPMLPDADRGFEDRDFGSFDEAANADDIDDALDSNRLGADGIDFDADGFGGDAGGDVGGRDGDIDGDR